MGDVEEDNPLEGNPSPVRPVIERGSETSSRIRQPNRRLRIFVLVTLAVILLFLVIDAMTEQRVKKASVGFVAWVAEHPFLGILAVIIVYIFATVLFVPASILTLGTGFAFRSAFDSVAKGVLMASTVRTRTMGSSVVDMYLVENILLPVEIYCGIRRSFSVRAWGRSVRFCLEDTYFAIGCFVWLRRIHFSEPLIKVRRDETLRLSTALSTACSRIYLPTIWSR